MKQMEINKKLEAEVQHAEKAFMVRYETNASAQDYETLRMLEKQIEDLQSEIEIHDKNNKDVEGQIRQIMSELATTTGTKLDDSID